MVLTEPDAGSDVGAGRTKAIQHPTARWHITGVKRFITSAECDMPDNVVHFVLARPEGAGPGTKGLSLFIVPKFHVDLETGELGERNGAYVTNVEHKMGLKVSHDLRGHLRRARAGGRHAARRRPRRHRPDVRGHRERPDDGRHQGDRHPLDRLPQRPRVREEARAGRRPHPDDRQVRAARHDHAPPRRPPLAHAAEGVRRGHARAGAVHRDASRTPSTRRRLEAARRSRSTRLGRELANRVNDLLLPLVKGVGSERAWVLLGTESLQTFGGSGFLQDYPIEQYIRDAKIDTLYEGTTAIQGLDFFFRKIVRDKGQALQHVADADPGVRQGPRRQRRSTPSASCSARALEDVQGIVGHMVGELMKPTRQGGDDVTNLYKVGQNTPACCSPPATSSSAGCCCARPRSRRRRSTAARPRKDA